MIQLVEVFLVVQLLLLVLLAVILLVMILLAVMRLAGILLDSTTGTDEVESWFCWLWYY